MKELLKFSSFNFVGNNRKKTISIVAHAVGSNTDREMNASENGVGSRNNDVNIMLRRTKGIILGLMMFMMSFNVNGQSCASNVSACQISGKTYECIGNVGSSITVTQLIAGGKLLPASLASVTPQYVVIKGQVVSDVLYKFAFGSHIIFDVSHHLLDPLVVTGHLHIENTIIQGCTDSWDRIKVDPGGQLTLTQCDVYDADNMAVYPMAGSNASLSNNTFEKCYQGVVAENGSFNHRIFQNTFEGGTAMTLGSHAGGKPKLAISGNNSGLMIMRKNIFNDYNHYSNSPAVDLDLTSSDFFGNEFFTCDRSIKSKNGQNGAFAHLEQNDFSNGEFDIYLETSGKLEQNESFSTEVSVVDIKRADGRKIEIDNNVFDFLSGGIYAGSSYGLDLQITKNSLTGSLDNSGNVFNFSEPVVLDLAHRYTGTVIDDNDINMSGAEGCVGVAVQRAGIGTKIFNNRMTAQSNNNPFLYENTGILLFVADKTTINQHNVLKGNAEGSGIYSLVSTNSDIGCDNNFDDYASGTFFSGFNGGAKIRDNEFTGNDIGVHLAPGDTYIGRQVHANNSWEDGAITPSWDILSQSTTNSDENKFVVSTNSGIFWPDPVNPIDIRDFQPGNYPYPCSPLPPPDFPQFGSPYPGDGFEWSFDYYRFGFLVDNPIVLTTDTAALSFYQANENGPIGLLYDDEQAWLTLRTMDASTQAAYDALILDRDSHIADLVVVSEDWGTNPTPINEALYNTLRAELDVIQQNLTTLNASNEAGWLVDAAVILSNISAIGTPNVPEQNYQDMLEIVLEHYISGANEWSTAHAASLALLANQCADDGGKAVDIARALLGDPLSYDDLVICSSSIPLSTDDAYNIDVLSISPNPTSGEVMVSWDEVIMADELIVYNMMGSVVKSESLTQQMHSTTIDMNDLINGVYIVKLMRGSEILQVNKLVLSK